MQSVTHVALPTDLAMELAEFCAGWHASKYLSPWFDERRLALGKALCLSGGLSCAWSGDVQPLSLPSLPNAVWYNIILRLPVGKRLVLRRLNRSWRQLVDEPAFWRDLDVDLSPSYFSYRLLLAVSAKVQGTMRSLDVSGRDFWGGFDEDSLVKVRALSDSPLSSPFATYVSPAGRLSSGSFGQRRILAARGPIWSRPALRRRTLCDGCFHCSSCCRGARHPDRSGRGVLCGGVSHTTSHT